VVGICALTTLNTRIRTLRRLLLPNPGKLGRPWNMINRIIKGRTASTETTVQMALRQWRTISTENIETIKSNTRGTSQQCPSGSSTVPISLFPFGAIVRVWYIILANCHVDCFAASRRPSIARVPFHHWRLILTLRTSYTSNYTWLRLLTHHQR